MKKHIPYFLFLACLFSLYGCRKDKLPKNMEPGYFKIYDDPASANSYRVLDVQETGDGGALILSELNHNTIYLIRAAADGKQVTAAAIGNGSQHPLPSLLQINGAYYAGAMDETGLFARILQVDDQSCSVLGTADIPSLLYPLAFSATDDNNILLLSYDRINYRSQLSKLEPGGQIQWTQSVNVYQDTETQIVAHLNGTGKRYPFYTAVWNGKYVMNGFYNYSFSFLLFGNSGPETVYNGSNYNSGTNAMQVLNNGNALITRFSFGSSYLVPSFAQSTGTIDLTDNMGGIQIDDAAENSDFRLGHIEIDHTVYTAYAYNTQNGRVCFSLLTENGTLKARHYFGNSETPFRIGNFRATADKGLILAGTLQVAGAFPRPALFKLNEKELYEILGLDYEKAQKE